METEILKPKTMPMVLISNRYTETKTMPKASKTNPTKIMTGLTFSSWFVNNWKKNTFVLDYTDLKIKQ